MKWKKERLWKCKGLRKKIKFENLISKADNFSRKIEEEMRNKVHELTQEYREESSNAIKMFCGYNGCGCFYLASSLANEKSRF